MCEAVLLVSSHHLRLHFIAVYCELVVTSEASYKPGVTLFKTFSTQVV